MLSYKLKEPLRHVNYFTDRIAHSYYSDLTSIGLGGLNRR